MGSTFRQLSARWTGRHRRTLRQTAIAILSAVAVFSTLRMLAQGRRDYYAVRVVSGSFAEAQDYYAANGAPDTFNEWKARYSFPERLAGESLDAYRVRTGIVVYYNRNELGLGRELGCSRFLDSGPSAPPLTGLACFVTNYGQRFDDSDDSLADAIAGINATSHEAYVYAPASTRPPTGGLEGLPVSFYAFQFTEYSPDGPRQDWSGLDAAGRRPVPQICLNCHGGTYNSEDKLVIGGVFTPLNPSIFTFSSIPGYTFEDQKGRIAALNAAMAALGANCPPSFECIGPVR